MLCVVKLRFNHSGNLVTMKNDKRNYFTTTKYYLLQLDKKEYSIYYYTMRMVIRNYE
jgi:hypothetical protein